ncbi:cyclic AMP response element-binding protein B isoform X1 [Lucilia cuprina]|uniref:cyclic AMP response element-binding protein B isoform X1 n=1 Tax=Lucilia cuprina TaxID=7375 RepID=UPI001F063B18|nr:cyclic AMP response element-binding protein B isoform X1 [Lucilia cuprina]XP_023304044.2 cyclic AMP response element-binding protein B isoform X1 [Lucilia cuprina]XP_023304045.2 cyclic AMP response element-binding protein B isoform X1 [Lucilia cuprina]XP_046803650.1 cyclic AMP response element-binding protein B isoform X1 [Lucilia cuprina]XP_046803651.1 cyclic AMP response element-binding protein B isoform X1 [Lucilia cuprina]XP_046803652.1 cyclic AMP response element-binding protein B isof
MDSIVEENGNSSNNIDDTNTSGTGGGGVGHNLTITASQQNPQQHPSQQQQQPAAVQSTQQQINLTNSNSQNIAPPPQNQIPVPASVAAAVAAGTVLTTTSNVVQYLSNNPHGLPVQSVIQAANQSSVIQTAAGNNTQTPVAIPKGLLYVNKPNTTVIHTTSGNAVQLPPHFQCKIKPEPNTHHLDTNSEDSFTDEDSPRGRRELTRRPSYNKIYSEISGPDISAGTNMQMSESVGLPALAPNSAGPTAGSLIHLQPENTPAFYLPNRMPYNPNNNVIAEDQTRKREIRLQKNREAARECRRKKKEYIKCLENRVAVLENQNKALIEELKSLKELYCQTKND